MAVEAVQGDAQVTLPKYVVFKGDNGKYLAAYSTDNGKYLQFGETDVDSELTTHEVVRVPDSTGVVMLKCVYWNTFWTCRNSSWIRADSDGSYFSEEMRFQPIKVDDQRVALRCLGNNKFCKRLTTEGKTNCLSAYVSSLQTYAVLRVEEPVISRRVHSIMFRLDSARIYDLQPGSLFKSTVTNSAPHAKLQLADAYSEKKSNSWKCGLSFTTGVKTTFQAGIPFVGKGKVELSPSTTVSGEWGGTEEKETTVTGNYFIEGGETVEVEVTVTGVHARCDVPFSYTQENLLTTGETVVTCCDDGLFTGLNTTDVNFEMRSLTQDTHRSLLSRQLRGRASDMIILFFIGLLASSVTCALRSVF